MKLLFYSGGDNDQNQALDQALLGLLGKKDPRATFIPVEKSNSKEDFDSVSGYFDYYGVDQMDYLPLDEARGLALEKALQSDMIYLSGGNTFRFLRNLRKSGMAHVLRTYARSGGVLVGESAGSILMTPTIHTAEIPDFDGDDNIDQISDYQAMGLVNFEFVPHYKNSKRYDRQILQHSRKNGGRPIFASPDGSGIIVNQDQFKTYGKVYAFHRGEKFIL